MARSDQERKEKMTTVYLDRRADEQQLAEELAAATIAAEEEAKKRAGAKIIGDVAGFLVRPAILMVLWNALMPGMFGVATLSYWSAMGLYLISRILFGNNKND
jgi:hypothetical protein